MTIKIALAGNPNSGKTTMFNSLTGSTQHVGNWPGVTVEKKEGKLKSDKSVIIQDLPGIYSLSPYTLEEVVARNYLLKEQPDAIINIVDASNLERNLYLTTQLTEIGVPVVIALNMMDIVNKRGDIIDTKKLGDSLGCQVVETSALKNTGIKEASQSAISAAAQKDQFEPKHKFAQDIEDALENISQLIKDKVNSSNTRWYAIKIFERDQEVMKEVSFSDQLQDQLNAIISACEEKHDDDSESIITNERYTYISNIINTCHKVKNKSALSTSDKIDQVVTNRFLALPIFALVMFLVYFISISTVGGWMTDWVNESLFGEIIPATLGSFLEGAGTAPWLYSLIMDGIVAGVGAVLGFLPQMLMLFICLAILEDCGYMARIAFVMDRIFRRFGLSGKSFIPMLVSTGCGVPGIMASRTIENDQNRRMTVMTTTFMPCGAKLPIIALIAGALFNESVWVAPSAYFIGIAAIIMTGIMLKKTKLFAGDPSPFVMELPAYHLPGIKGVLRSMYDRGMSFVKKAGTIVLLSTILIWFLSSFNTSLEMVETNQSILAAIGNAVAPIFTPLGWGDWRAAVATFTGLIAKENIVATFGVLFGFAEVAENGLEYWSAFAAAFSSLSAYSFLVFNLLCAPCFAAIGAIRREMMSPKWTWFAISYQCLFAYVISLIIYQTGLLIQGNGFGIGTAIAFLCLLLILYMLFRKPYAGDKTLKLKGGAPKSGQIS